MVAVQAFRSVYLAVATAASVAGDWPQWRGPNGDSVSGEIGLPLRWSEQSGVAWKIPIPEWGASTPAISGDAIFLTTQSDDKLLLLKLRRRTGEVEWTREVGVGEARRKAARPAGGTDRRQQKFHDLHNLASPSPVTDGKLVFVHFGNGEFAAFDFQGNCRWKRNLQDDNGTYTIWWGHANSPVLQDDLIVSVCMQDSLSDLGDPPAPSYLIAHDAETGFVRWRTPRMTVAKAEQCDAYTTPILVKRDGRLELVVMGGNQVDGYELATGKLLWHLPGLVGGRTVTGPTAAHGLVYVTHGMKGPLVAVKANANGPLSDRHIVWSHKQNTPDTCCPVVSGDLLFIVSDNGIAQCLNAHTGDLQWTERLEGVFKASPLAADGRIYFLNTRGVCTVVAAATRFERLAENRVDDETLASPAVSNGCIFLRGRKALYCIGTASPGKN